MKHWHVGILTPDLDKSIEAFCALPGVTRNSWSVMDIEFADSDMVTGDGGRLRAAMGRVGGVVYELLEPQDDGSYHAQTMNARGPGVHHNAYIIENGQDAAVASMLAAGARIVWEARHDDQHVYYLEFPDKTVWEIINSCPFMPD